MENKKEFNKYFWRFMWSSILIALSGCLGNVVDAIIVGNLIGADGVSAINLSKPMVQFMFTISMLLSTGAGMLVGMELGKKDHRRAAYIFTLSIGGCIGYGLFMTLCGFLFPTTITGWLCQSDLLFDYTYEYLRVMMLGAPLYMLAWGMATMVGVDGSPRLTSVAILIDNALNLFLDIVFIKWCGWGIEGSAWATVLGHVVGVAIMCWHFRYPDNHLKVVLRDNKPAWGIILSQGAPLAVASICLTLLMFCSNHIVLTTGGRTFIFAFSVCMNLLQIYNLFLAGTCRTIQSLGAIEVGKGDSQACKLVVIKSFRFITLAMIVTCALVWMFPEAVAQFFGADEEDMIAESVRALKLYALSLIPFCYIYTLMIVYKLYSYHKMALFLSFALSLTVIPVMWLVARYATDYLWYSFLIAYAIEGALILLFHKVGHMKFELKTENIEN